MPPVTPLLEAATEAAKAISNCGKFSERLAASDGILAAAASEVGTTANEISASLPKLEINRISEILERAMPNSDRLRQARDYMVGLVKNALPAAGEDLRAVEAARSQLEHTFMQFPNVIPKLGSTLQNAYERAGIDTGKLSIYAGGSRTTTKPLGAGSDIDLFLCHEKPIIHWGSSSNVDNQAYNQLKKSIAFNAFPKICDSHQILPTPGVAGRFQIWKWDGLTPEQFNAKKLAHEVNILLWRQP